MDGQIWMKGYPTWPGTGRWKCIAEKNLKKKQQASNVNQIGGDMYWL